MARGRKVAARQDGTCAGCALLLGEEASERSSSLAAMLAKSQIECGKNLNIPIAPATLRETTDRLREWR